MESDDYKGTSTIIFVHLLISLYFCTIYIICTFDNHYYICVFYACVKYENWDFLQMAIHFTILGKSHRQKSLVGYSLWGRTVRNDWSTEHRVKQIVNNYVKNQLQIFFTSQPRLLTTMINRSIFLSIFS